MVAREILRGHNYLALWRMRRVYPAFRENAARYFLGRGEYPYACRVRTPAGIVAPTLFSRDDMWTVNEVFCRQDYGADASSRAVVDVGSNIGISALYFLTRNPTAASGSTSRCPRNVERLRRNLAGYEDRYAVPRSRSPSVRGAPSSASRTAAATAASAWRPRARSRSPASASTRCSSRCWSRCPSGRPQDRHRGVRARDPAGDSARAAAPGALCLPRAGAPPGVGARAIRRVVPQRDLGASQPGTACLGRPLPGLIAVGLRDPLERGCERQSPRIGPNHAAVERRSASPPASARAIAAARSSGERRAPRTRSRPPR